MKEFNLTRLMDSCCITINEEVYDELFDYLIEIDVDLNTLNIDDLVVNSLSYIDKDEGIDEDNVYVLKEADDGFYILE